MMLGLLLLLPLALLLRHRIRQLVVVGRQFHPHQGIDMTGMLAVVTGGNTGIGFATVLGLLRANATVILTSRCTDRAADAAARALSTTGLSDHAERCSGVRLVLDDGGESVRDFVEWMTHSHAQVHLLVNNAGVHLDLLSQWSEPRRDSTGDVELMWRTNTLGTAQVLFGLLPLLRAAEGRARVVNVCSMLHTMGRNSDLFPVASASRGARAYNSWNAYGNSKLAIVHLTLELCRVEPGIKWCCVHPGAVFTGVSTRGLEGNRFILAIKRCLKPVEQWLLRTPEEGAMMSLYCALDKGLSSGGYFRNLVRARCSNEAGDAVVSSKLWRELKDWAYTMNQPTTTPQ